MPTDLQRSTPPCWHRLPLGGHVATICHLAMTLDDLVAGARVAGLDPAGPVTVSRNEMLTALNAPDQFVLALVEVSTSGPEHDLVHYLRRPFDGVTETHFAETSRNFSWTKMWDSGTEPAAHFAPHA